MSGQQGQPSKEEHTNNITGQSTGHGIDTTSCGPTSTDLNFLIPSGRPSATSTLSTIAQRTDAYLPKSHLSSIAPESQCTSTEPVVPQQRSSAAVANNIAPYIRTAPIVAFPTTSSYSSG
ncbi:hypothetical protein B0T13DRAFT_400395 [Neurospora crassa]|nr:hypothetical protein B0T13DRAFT_400395 [Neurospora crassa]